VTICIEPKEDFSKAFQANRHVYDYVFTDSEIERKFVRELDSGTEVEVYAELPKAFLIPTPVGNYNPDWAIAFIPGTVKHIYFIAETKGSLSSMDLRKIGPAGILQAHAARSTLRRLRIGFRTKRVPGCRAREEPQLRVEPLTTR
jgi:restriction endonuclease